MWLRDPFTKALWDGRRSLLGWAVAIAGIAMMYTAFYPSISNPAMAAAIKNYPSSLKKAFNLQDLTSPQGYLGSYVFGLLVPVLLAVFMIITGTRAVAGDEETGTLDLVLAHPVSRPRLLLSRLGALVVQALAICALVYLLLLAISGPTKISPVGAGYLAAATIQLALFGICFGALTLAIGAATGRRAAAIGAGTVVAVLGYFANNLAPQVSGLEWARFLSPYHYMSGNQPLVNGLDLAACAILLGVSAVFAVVGTALFRRRDIAV
jgi:ABC-2 type transport system permease protein